MNASHRILSDQGYVDLTVEGSVTVAELAAHIRSVWSDPAWKPIYNGLIDFSSATLDLSDDELAALSKGMADDPRCSFGKWAFVVRTATAFAKLRHIDDAADLKSTLRIFFDRRSAESWLLRPPPP